jgi:hypothetical protein
VEWRDVSLSPPRVGGGFEVVGWSDGEEEGVGVLVEVRGERGDSDEEEEEEEEGYAVLRVGEQVVKWDRR